MKRRSILLLLPLAVIALLTIWFFMKSHSDAASTIPTDARAVAALDVKELSRTTGVSADRLFSRFGIAGADEAGLNFSAPVYGFVSDGGHFGISVSVKSKARLAKVLQKAGASVESWRGIQWAMLRNWMAAFDSDKVLIMGPVSTSEAIGLRGQMVTLMKQDKDDNTIFGEMENRPHPLRLMSRLDVMPGAYVKMLKEWLPAGTDLSRVTAFASLDAQGRSFTLNVELLSDDRQVQEALSQADSLWRPIQGSLLGLGPDAPLLWATAGLRGDRLLGLLRRNPAMRTRLIALNMCVDADMMLRSIDGDVSVSVPNTSLDPLILLNRFKLPPALFTATLSNTDFLHNVDSWKSGLATDAGVRFRVLRDNDFHLSAGDVSAYFGVRDDRLYVTSNPQLADQACRPSPAPSMQALLPKMEGRVFFATFDASVFMKGLGPLAQLLSSGGGILQLLSAVERINLSATSSHNITLEVQCNRELADIIGQ